MENNKIKFGFVWKVDDFDEISPKIINIARKMLEMNFVKVEPELENERILIRHIGVCSKSIVKTLSKSFVHDDFYKAKFTLKNTKKLTGVCTAQKKEECDLTCCPIIVAGYLYYLKYKDDEHEDDLVVKDEEFNLSERNIVLLNKLGLNEEQINCLMPLTVPEITSLRCAFIGDEGTNKEQTIQKLAKYLYDIGKISDNAYVETPISEINKNFKFEKDKLYSLTQIEEFLINLSNNDDFSSSAETTRRKSKDAISKIINQKQGKYIILNCSESEYKRFLNANSKLPYIFESKILFKDFDNKEILNIFEKNLSAFHKKKYNKKTQQKVKEYLDRNRKYFPFKNHDLGVFLASYVSRYDKFVLPNERYDDTAIVDLNNNLIGMNNIKKQIIELNNFLTLKIKLEKQGIKFPDFNLHMLFTGNPGTGKTTIARLIAKILFDLGYIKENKTIEVSAKDLVAAYSGQSSIKTNRVITSALGGVLFIDEAYSLIGDHGNADAVATLIKAMEDNKDELVVILAGYTKEMTEFIRSNSGISSTGALTCSEISSDILASGASNASALAGKIRQRINARMALGVKDIKKPPWNGFPLSYLYYSIVEM